MKFAPSSLALLLIAAGCSTARYSTEPGGPSVVLPAHFAEGKGEPRPAPRPSAAPPAAAPPPAASAEPAPDPDQPSPTPPAPSNLPDPTPLRQAEQVEYELELKDGKVSVVSVKAVKLPSPVVTPRRMGRYAIELGIGKELIERLRFDFPGTAADEPSLGAKKPLYAPLTMGERAIARIKLQVPQSLRVRRAVLVDRAQNAATELPWPLPEVAKAAAAPGAAKPAQP
ncbi:MAG: hypothetical protein EOO73_28970 [Myxococcales bacterium]|nr:MAG: hypothetical protein EOO73_28970 [Myxococcales bacterium]